jgi:hypothetical protein
MIEKTILDRVPKYPGRVMLSPVAGKANTFDMVRADEPNIDGTPIDKATLDSIIKSRLNGRYYVPNYSKKIYATTKYTVSPIPTNGWVTDGTEKATNGAYIATASLSQNNPYRAFDGTWSTSGGWRPSHTDDEPWIAINLGSPIVLRKVRIYFISDAWATTCTLSGSNNGTNWTDIATVERPTTNKAIDWSFNNSVSYQYYKLSFDYTGVELYGWALTDYDVTTYENAYTVGDEWATSWTTGQIALITIPNNVTTLGIVQNSINGIKINTILQPNRRYELVYNGTAFTAKEV